MSTGFVPEATGSGSLSAMEMRDTMNASAVAYRFMRIRVTR